MRSLVISTVLLMSTATLAYAQEGQNSHTLNEQVQRINQGEAPVPAPWERIPTNAPTQITTVNNTVTPQSGGIDSQGSGAIPALPLPVQSAGGVTYLSGGVGDEELAELKSKEKEFNVHLMMTAPGGAFVSDVHLRIVDANGAAVLDISNAGPYVYAHVKPGNYKIDATVADGGANKQMAFTLRDNGDFKQQIEFPEPGMTTEHKPTATIE